MNEQLRLLEQLIAATPQPRWHRFLREMYDQLTLPMADVLARVPGETVVEKAHAIGIARNTYYEWLNESFRPNVKQSLALETMTGFPAAQIHGERTAMDGSTVRQKAIRIKTATNKPTVKRTIKRRWRYRRKT
jgi:hypothetical protein